MATNKEFKDEITRLERDEIRRLFIDAYGDNYVRYFSPDGEGVLDLIELEGAKKPAYYELKIVKKTAIPSFSYSKDLDKSDIATNIAASVCELPESSSYTVSAATTKKGLTVYFEFISGVIDIFEMEIIKKRKTFEEKYMTKGSKCFHNNCERLKDII